MQPKNNPKMAIVEDIKIKQVARHDFRLTWSDHKGGLEVRFKNYQSARNVKAKLDRINTLEYPLALRELNLLHTIWRNNKVATD